jgi:hypothetical protein
MIALISIFFTVLPPNARPRQRFSTIGVLAGIRAKRENASKEMQQSELPLNISQEIRGTSFCLSHPTLVV